MFIHHLISKKLIVVTGLVCLFIYIASQNNQLLSYTSGAPLETTNAPGETSCSTNSLCHTGTPNSGNASILLTAMEDLSSGYTPGQTYTLMPYIYQNGISKVGFQTVALFENGEAAGSVAIINTRTQVNYSGNKEYVTHTASGNTNVGMHDWMYEWIAPPTGSGRVIVYAAFIAANNDMTATGDSIYTDSLIIDENTSGIIDVFKSNFQLFNASFLSSSSSLTFQYYSPTNRNVNFTLYNNKGQFLLHQKLKLEIGKNAFHISNPGLSSGIYYIEINDEDQKWVKKCCII